MPSMRYNTLEFVNQLLSRLDLQPVSTLGETEDAEQVLDIVQGEFARLDLYFDWFPKREVIRLSTATGTNNTVADWTTNFPDIPWAMPLPSGVEHVYKVYYKNNLMRWLPAEEMYHRIEKLSAFLTDADPRFWTMNLKGNEDYVIFDKYDVTDEAQLTSSNSTIYCTKYPTTDPSTDTASLAFPNTVYAALFSKCMSEGHRALTGRRDLAIDYEREFNRDYAHMLAQYKRTKPRRIHPGRIFFGRATPSGIAIDPSDYTDVTP